MKMKLNLLALAALALLSTINHQVSTAFAQGTAFTYQGQLYSSGSLANGSYDLKLTLFDAITNGSVIAGPITNSAVTVSNGLFTTVIDFGDVFDGNIYWLRIQVETNGAGSFATLSPRQELTPTPYAEFATTASNLSGTIPVSQLPAGVVTNNESSLTLGGSFSGNGTGLTNVNAATLGGLAAGNFWQVGGNTGVATGNNYIGNNDNQYLDIHANGVRVFRLRLFPDGLGVFSNAPNVVGGSSVNLTTPNVVGATIGGGGGYDTNGFARQNEVEADFGTISGGLGNINAGIGSFIGGGGFDGTYFQGNTILGNAAVIGGGLSNNITINGGYSFIGGGYFNAVTVDTSVIGGGAYNTASAEFATIGGGYFNSASGYLATVGGGYFNLASGEFSTVCGGTALDANNTASGVGSLVGGGGYDGSDAAPNVASGGGAVVAGGVGNTNSGLDSVVCGGLFNFVGGSGSFIGGGGYDGNTIEGNYINANAATISGGFSNRIPAGARYAFIGGGASNSASATAASVLGGGGNIASGQYSTVAGGNFNTASGNFSFAAGTYATASHYGSFVWGDGAGVADDTGPEQFVALADGGFYFYTGPSGGAELAPGATSWTAISDRNAKKNFQPVDTVAVLNKLAAIPVEQWNYKWEGDTDTPNIGPMAQDFKAAFYPGRDDKGISTLEFDGVELAAIQGLNEKVEAGGQRSEARIQKLEAENAELKARLERLEKLIESKNQDPERKEK